MRVISDKDLVNGGCPGPRPNVEWAAKPYGSGSLPSKPKKTRESKEPKPKPKPIKSAGCDSCVHELEGGKKKARRTTSAKPKRRVAKGEASANELEGGKKRRKTVSKKTKTKSKSTKRRGRGASAHELEGGKKKRKVASKKTKTKSRSTKRRGRGASANELEGGKKKRKVASKKTKSTKKKSTTRKRKGGNFWDDALNVVKSVAPVALSVLGGHPDNSNDHEVKALKADLARQTKQMKKVERKVNDLIKESVADYRDGMIDENNINMKDANQKKRLGEWVAREKANMTTRLKIDLVNAQENVYRNWISNF